MHPYPPNDIGDKKIILLSGFEKARGDRKTLAITGKDQLQAAAYVAGLWVPAA